ncbi:MAG: HAD family acid phosphatase, partial [archaeon]
RIFKNEAEKKNYIPYNEELEDAVIFDIDGTIALMNGRSPFDWTRVSEDLPHEPVVRVAQDYILRDDVRVYFVSGRDGSCRKETENWLSTHGLDGYDGLFMREAGDGRKDSIIKEEIFYEEFKDNYNILAVFDDRNQTVDKWRELGVPCFQVAPGAF